MNATNPYVPPDTKPQVTPIKRRRTTRHSIFGLLSGFLTLALFLQFSGSRWGVWPWRFSEREAGFDRIELVLFFLAPLGVAILLALFAGPAKRWILGGLAITFLLSLV